MMSLICHVFLLNSKEDVEKCKQKDLLEEMLMQMTGEYPALSRVFVDERDLFLAYKLRIATTPVAHPLNPEGMYRERDGPIDTAYKWCSCHSGSVRLLCKLCRNTHLQQWMPPFTVLGTLAVRTR